MKISPAGLKIITDSEALRLKAYADSGGVWTIGWGHTKGVKRGMVCTRGEAEAWLVEDVLEAEKCVEKSVSVPLLQAEFSALVSFVFNVGCPAFNTSTLLRKLNAGDREGAMAQMPRWIHDNGKVQRGLIKRRRAERYLFEHGVLMEQEPVLVEDRQMPVPAWLATLGWEAIRHIPDMVSAAKDPAVDKSERNLKILGEVAEIVTTATGKANAQEAIEAITTDPKAKEAAAVALRESYFDIMKLESEGVEKARVAYDSERNFPIINTNWLKLNFMHVISLMILTAAYALGAWVLGGDIGISTDTKALVIGMLITSSVGGVIAFWFNTTATSDWKNKVIAGQRKEI